MTSVFTRMLVFSHDDQSNLINIHDAKYNKIVHIPFDTNSPETTVLNWLDSKHIPHLGVVENHVICEFNGPVPSTDEFNIPTVHVIEVSTFKNDHGIYVLKLYSSRYTQSVYTDIRDGYETIENAYIWLKNKGFNIVSSDADSLKMYVISNTFKPLYTTPELV